MQAQVRPGFLPASRRLRSMRAVLQLQVLGEAQLHLPEELHLLALKGRAKTLQNASRSILEVVPSSPAPEPAWTWPGRRPHFQLRNVHLDRGVCSHTHTHHVCITIDKQVNGTLSVDEFKTSTADRGKDDSSGSATENNS